MRPEDVIGQLSEFFEAMVEVVIKNRGYKLTSSSATALWLSSSEFTTTSPQDISRRMQSGQQHKCRTK